MRTLTTIAPQQWLFTAREYSGDPFGHVDGHYVGHDGFVVPNDFAEFYQRFPDHIKRWVKRHAGRCSSKEDIDDWTQDLCAHMSSLPASSKYRERGKRDVIQSFDPFRHYGASLPRFLNYVNRCLANKFRSIHAHYMKDPMSHAEPLSFSETTGEDSEDDQPHRALVKALNAIDFDSRKRANDILLIAQFVDFLRARNPPILSVLGTLTGTRTEAAQKLGATGAEVGRLYRQIRELGHSFLNWNRPRQRNQCSVERYGTKTRISTANSIPPPLRLRADLNGTYWDRVELYKEVWNQPLLKLSRKYGISDVRLGKVCRRLKIPHPGRGYWAKRAVGLVLDQEQLPTLSEVLVVRRLKKIRSRGL